MTRSLNAMLGGDNQAAYERAQSAVEGADTVREAVEAVGVLEELDTELVVEARAVLDAIPPSLDQAIIGALESAFEDGAAVFIDWERGRHDGGQDLRGAGRPRAHRARLPRREHLRRLGLRLRSGSPT